MRTYLRLYDEFGNAINYWYDDEKPLKMKHREDQVKGQPPKYKTHANINALRAWLKTRRGWVSAAEHSARVKARGP